MKFSSFLFILFIGSFYGATAYRLNVPRVLLPYYAKNQVSYILEVKEPDGGCFYWKSTRPDIVSVESLNKNGGCSDKALITARSRHSTEQSAVILAIDSGGGTTLTCDVRVDVVDRIEVYTTTGLLFIEEPPARITVSGFNKRGNEFSTLGSIPFEWTIKANESASLHPLKLVSFSDSKYEVPFGIAELERQSKQGASVLVDGIHTGKAILSARIVDPEFAGVNSCTVELFVIQKAILVPSEDLYLTVGASVNVGVSIVKESGIEAVKLPTPLFRVSIDDPSICQWDEKTSRVIAKKIGQTRLTLVDTTFEKFSKGMFEFVRITVVPPASMGYFYDQGESWQIVLNGQYFRADKLDLSDTSAIEHGRTAQISFKHPGEFVTNVVPHVIERLDKIPDIMETKATKANEKVLPPPKVKNYPSQKSAPAGSNCQVGHALDKQFIRKSKNSSSYSSYVLGIPAIFAEFFERNFGLFILLLTVSFTISAVSGLIWILNIMRPAPIVVHPRPLDASNSSRTMLKTPGQDSTSFINWSDKQNPSFYTSTPGNSSH